ncbi:YbfB/YjiJ family MFS transporter, partial [Salmonella enterica subsp. enterica serovar Anatum]|nr:YbfB/YjiJ family MFS transporter [Salmonella enterica subsp. enterica serovar Anatum]
GWLWAAKHWGVLPCLTANLLIQSACVLLSLASDSLLLLILSSAGAGKDDYRGSVCLGNLDGVFIEIKERFGDRGNYGIRRHVRF